MMACALGGAVREACAKLVREDGKDGKLDWFGPVMQ